MVHLHSFSNYRRRGIYDSEWFFNWILRLLLELPQRLRHQREFLNQSLVWWFSLKQRRECRSKRWSGRSRNKRRTRKRIRYSHWMLWNMGMKVGHSHKMDSMQWFRLSMLWNINLHGLQISATTNLILFIVIHSVVSIAPFKICGLRFCRCGFCGSSRCFNRAAVASREWVSRMWTAEVSPIDFVLSDNSLIKPPVLLEYLSSDTIFCIEDEDCAHICVEDKAYWCNPQNSKCYCPMLYGFYRRYEPWLKPPMAPVDNPLSLQRLQWLDGWQAIRLWVSLPKCNFCVSVLSNKWDIRLKICLER